MSDLAVEGGAGDRHKTSMPLMTGSYSGHQDGQQRSFEGVRPSLWSAQVI